MADFTAQQRAAIDFRGQKLLVSAAAGSGKTRVLVGRVIERIEREKLDLDDFLIITFTRAAAAELRDRFTLELGRRAAESGDRHLRRQLSSKKDGITTIDAFCAALVREYAHLTDLYGRRTVSGGELDGLYADALGAALERIYSSESPDLRAAEQALGYGRNDQKFSDAVQRIYKHTRAHPFPKQWERAVVGQYESADFSRTAFGEELIASARRNLDGGRQLLNEALELSDCDEQMSVSYSPALCDDLRRVDAAEAALERGDIAAAREAFSAPNLKLKPVRGRSDDPLVERVKSLRKLWQDKLKVRALRALVDPDECSSELELQLPAVRGLLLAANIFGEELERIKAERRAAEFLDYQHAAIGLLAAPLPDGRCEPSAIARTLSGRYCEVLVDEFQDTNELQTLICDLITDAPGRTLFMVGDVKQSIYRFRLARPEIFLRRYSEFPPVEAGEPSARQTLSLNFRSRPEVLGAANYFFRRAMTGGSSEISYDRDQYLYPGRKCEALDDRKTELCILNAAASDESNEEDGATSVDAVTLEAKYVASRIAEMLRGGFQVPDGQGGSRPLRPEDIAVLLRSPKNTAFIYRDALESLGVPCSSAADSGGAELTALLSVLTAVDNPYLDVPLIGAMTSPVFGFSADELAEIRAKHPRERTVYNSVLRAAREGDERAAELVRRLGELRRAASEEPADKFILRLYAESGLVGVYSALPGGENRRERLNRAYLAARSYSRESRYGLHGFIEYLESAIERGDFSTVGGGEGVCITSVHKSKGLEFEVVFCSALSKQINFDDARGDLLIHSELGVGFKLYDRERRCAYPSGALLALRERSRRETIAEELRLLYVGMTRAKEKLVLTCALSDAERKLGSMLAAPWSGENSLMSILSPADVIIPLAAEHPDGAELRAVAGADRVVPLEAEDGRLQVRVIGLLREDGSPRTEQPETPPEPTADESVRAALERNLAFEYPDRSLRELPSKLTATQIKGLRADDEPDEDRSAPPEPESDEPRRRFSLQARRPRFISENAALSPTERGTALHAAAQFVDFERCATAEGALCEIERIAREGFITERQAEAVSGEVEKIVGFASSELCARALASGSMRREFKFSILDGARRYFPDAPDGETVLLQGICDLFFEEDGGLVIVDFKSDRIREGGERERAEQYRPQLDAYSRALGRIFGLPVKERALYFFASGRAVKI